MSRLYSRIRAWGPEERRTAVALGGVVLLALAVRLPGLDLPLSNDEISAFDAFGKKGFTAIFLRPYYSANHPLSSLCTWIAYSTFGEHDWAIRLPSLAFGLAGIALVYVLARRWYLDRSIALVAVLFLAISPAHAGYSCSARGYVLGMFFAVLSALFLDDNLTRPSFGRTTALAGSVFLMGLSQLFFLILTPAWGVVLAGYAVRLLFVPSARNRTAWAAVFASAAALGVGVGLNLAVYSVALPLPSALAARLTTGVWPDSVQTWLAGAELSTAYPLVHYVGLLTGIAGEIKILLAWALLMTLVGLWSGFSRNPRGGFIALATLIVPAAIVAAFQLHVAPRFLLGLLPFYVLASSAGLVACVRTLRPKARELRSSLLRRKRVLGALVAIGPAALSGAELLPVYVLAFPHAPAAVTGIWCDWKSAARFVSEHMDSDDVIMYHKQTMEIAHYLNRYMRLRPMPQAEPPNRCRLWFIDPGGGGNEEPRADLPPGIATTNAAAFGDCTVHVGEVQCADWRQAPLPPISVQPAGPWADRFAPWIANQEGGTAEILVGEDASFVYLPEEHAPPNAIHVCDRDGCLRMSLLAPATPITGGKRVLFRGWAHDGTPSLGLHFVVRFNDAAGQPIEEWTAFAPYIEAGPVPGAWWHPYQVSAIAPPGAVSFSVGIRIEQQNLPGAHATIGDLALWMDGPGTAPEPPH